MSVRIPIYTFDPIEYLLDRKFPLQRSPFLPIVDELPPETRPRELVQHLMKAYESELRKKPPEEIAALVENERELESREAVEREQNRIYNRPEGVANFEFWSRAAYWSIDEGIALTFGREPTRVSLKLLGNVRPETAFVREYNERFALATRAKAMGIIGETNLPGAFVAWAKRLGLSVTPELEEALAARGTWIGDWQSLYEQEARRHKEAREWAAAEVRKTLDAASRIQSEAVAVGNDAKERNKTIAEQRALIETLYTKLNERPAPEPTKLEKPGWKRERESLLKMIIGMAREKFGYDPAAAKSPTTGRIANAIRLQGLNLDEDTIRAYLQEARDLLPSKTEES